MDLSELEPSQLGTKSYWEEVYSKDVNNYESYGDPGDVWFGEDSAFRVIEWISQCGVDKNTPIIDLGCGNAYTLTELAREGFTNLLGVDYCVDAIKLAKKVNRELFPQIKFKVFDVVEDDVEDLKCKFGVVHDKGTYDAVSLNPENPKANMFKYISQVTNMLQENGFFVITSCNWTEVELIRHFEGKLRMKCVLPAPQFRFGGKVGSVVSSVVFVKDKLMNSNNKLNLHDFLLVDT